MTAPHPPSLLRRLASHESLSFWLTNAIPRRTLTLLVGWVSRIEHPVVCGVALAVWRRFTDIDLADAAEAPYRSMHGCFTRRLRPGSRPFDTRPGIVASPSDGIVGACGRIEQSMVLQAKDSSYRLTDLLGGDDELARRLEGGTYVTLRLTSGMYHRFHAPHDCRVDRVTYISGDAFNVNPATLRRIPRLFCRNERAVIRCRLRSDGELIVLVPVAAILVASIRLSFLDVRLHLRYRGPNKIDCDAILQQGDEMGWFEQGSTIVVLAPQGFDLAAGIAGGDTIKAGVALLERAID
jgi:phosphatidylserine decarboxylase